MSPGWRRSLAIQAGQQAQAQRVVAVGRARGLDLGAGPADALAAEERHRVGRLHLRQLPLAAAQQQLLPVPLHDPRPQPGRHQHLASDSWQGDQAAEEVLGDGGDAVAVGMTKDG